MKEVLLLVHDDPGQEARYAAALELVRTLDGHLSCIDVVATPARLYRHGGGLIADLVLREEQRIERGNKVALRSRLMGEGMPFSWADAAGDLDEILGRVAGLSDLMVLNANITDDVAFDPMAATIRSVVGRVHTPILAVPCRVTEYSFGEEAVVLWDGSSSAKAALTAAMPLIRHAKRVTILYAEDGSLTTSLADAHAYLAHQGITAHCTQRALFGESAARSIERFLQRHQPSLVVMGAFGHGRFHDALFGGVTSHLLATATVPLLLASHR